MTTSNKSNSDFLERYDSAEEMFALNGLELVQTCGACPEQYDVYKNDRKIAYMRLRHGYFYVTKNGEKIHESLPNGDGLFECEERMQELYNAMLAILNT